MAYIELRSSSTGAFENQNKSILPIFFLFVLVYPTFDGAIWRQKRNNL